MDTLFDLDQIPTMPPGPPTKRKRKHFYPFPNKNGIWHKGRPNGDNRAYRCIGPGCQREDKMGQKLRYTYVRYHGPNGDMCPDCVKLTGVKTKGD